MCLPIRINRFIHRCARMIIIFCCLDVVFLEPGVCGEVLIIFVVWFEQGLVVAGLVVKFVICGA